MPKRNAIVITGTPGVGKTTVARGLASKLGLRLIELNTLAREGGAIGGRDPKRGSLIIKPRRVRALLRRALEGEEGTVIIEGHYGEVVPEELVRAAVVIRLNPLVLRGRLRERGYDEVKVGENVEAELIDVCLSKAVDAFGERVREVDATGCSEEELEEEVWKAASGEGGLPPGSIDWASKLEGRDLEEALRG